MECSFPSLAYGSSKVIVIKLKPQVGYHEHHVVATSSHEGFLAEGGHPVTAYVTHVSDYSLHDCGNRDCTH